MGSIAIVFTATVGLLVVWQFLAGKGTKSHVKRGVLVLLLSIPPAVLNTLSRFSRDENILDHPAVLVHIVLGGLFYLAVLCTILTGIHVSRTGTRSRWHKASAYYTIVLFLVMFLVPIVMRTLGLKY